MHMASLQQFLVDSARRTPDATAIVEPGHGTVTYADLNALSDRVRDRLAALGVQRGDRVGLCMRKSIDTLAAIFGALKAGAAYVPVDPTAPAARGWSGAKSIFLQGGNQRSIKTRGAGSA
jgi:acyl-CoA synthetase (AMP-forming)/AMP-acid ligase II